jgi:cyclopropane-fatty-acyl-phospholipid synthase
MAELARSSQQSVALKSLHLLQYLLSDFHPRNFAIQLWEGSAWAPEAGQFCRFTWRIHDPGLLQTLITSASEVSLGEAYIRGEFDIDGDIEAVFPLAAYLINRNWSVKDKLHLGGLLLGLPHRQSQVHGLDLHGPIHSKQRDRQAVSYHYDVSNDFYALWLDSSMSYSGAYFLTPNSSLEEAQKQKLDYLCRKLRLKTGERLLDIGCGWGGLILHAACEYGVQATGITLSSQQLEFARQRIAQEGLSSRCEVQLLDYRDVNEPSAFDKVVSIGMIEHVGEARLRTYFDHAFQILRSGGVFLVSGIGRPGNRPAPEQPTFTDAYVFPDGELVPISTTLDAAEKAGFEVRDVENLREHYGLTVHHWLQRLEARAAEARAIAGELKYRIWRLYLAGSAYYFQSGKLDLYQTILLKDQDGKNALPMMRPDWY